MDGSYPMTVWSYKVERAETTYVCVIGCHQNALCDWLSYFLLPVVHLRT